ncbi:unnamed protein product [Fraxinus pennsylvanica]|uniref:Uncharacterized protein n=1 Tax=Fraxinus pennsylvanica TaxID=56036 RepID=A0AAD2A0M8_9LAMI|nr:unnamed protein product [Fraxinus pennsylvanica]
MGMFQSSDQLQANASDQGFGIKRRLTIDHDENLRIYSLINSTGLWMITRQAFSQPCQVHGVCGRNAICVYALKPKCICTPGFEVNDPSDWSDGCKPAFKENLLNSQVKFVELSQTNYIGFDLDFQPDFTLEACQKLCLGIPIARHLPTGHEEMDIAMQEVIFLMTLHLQIFLEVKQGVPALVEAGYRIISKGRHRLLANEYVDNKSLDKHLFNSNFLGWKQRYAVALGMAKDSRFWACKTVPERWPWFRGTKGYMAPEWALNHRITAKVNVYGYGVVVLEMIKGMKLSNWAVDSTDNQELPLKSLCKTVKEKVQCGNSSWVKSIVDPRLEGTFRRNQAATLILIAISCVEEYRSKRPTMASVAQTLMECEDGTEITIPVKM